MILTGPNIGEARLGALRGIPRTDHLIVLRKEMMTTVT